MLGIFGKWKEDWISTPQNPSAEALTLTAMYGGSKLRTRELDNTIVM